MSVITHALLAVIGLAGAVASANGLANLAGLIRAVIAAARPRRRA